MGVAIPSNKLALDSPPRSCKLLHKRTRTWIGIEFNWETFLPVSWGSDVRAFQITSSLLYWGVVGSKPLDKFFWPFPLFKPEISSYLLCRWLSNAIFHTCMCLYWTQTLYRDIIIDIGATILRGPNHWRGRRSSPSTFTLGTATPCENLQKDNSQSTRKRPTLWQREQQNGTLR